MNKAYTITLDDDPVMHKIIARCTGLPSLPFISPEALMRKRSSYKPMAVFVDINLGANISGIETIPILKTQWPSAAIFVVTGTVDAQVVGSALASGAHDFLRKPLHKDELNARLQTRLLEISAREKQDQIDLDGVIFSASRLTLERKGSLMSLSRLEGELLLLLWNNRELLITRNNIKQRLWGRAAVADNTLDKKISNLRLALKRMESHYAIFTMSKRGYVLKRNQVI